MLRKIVNKISRLASSSQFSQVQNVHNQLVKGPVDKIVNGVKFTLFPERYLDGEIYTNGSFEPETLRVMLSLLRQGDVFLDVGANIGFFTLLIANHIGSNGQVYAFEPTEYYSARLKSHVELNCFKDRTQIHRVALSNFVGEIKILIGDSSATLYQVDGGVLPRRSELIQVSTLDNYFSDLKRPSLIKVDIDGAEKAFLVGGSSALQAWKSPMVIEFSQELLDAAGTSCEILKLQLEQLGYAIYSEKTFKKYNNRRDFLKECGNYAFSTNAWCFHLDAELPDMFSD